MLRLRACQSLAAVALFAGLRIAAQPRPSAEEQAHMLEVARDTALHYAQSLPDFVCNEMVRRSSAQNAAQIADTLTIQLTYFGQQEKYKLLAVNGTPTSQSLESISGFVTGGEFGSVLFRIFDPMSAAEFHWKGWTTIAKRSAAVFTYRVEQANSHNILGYLTETGALRTATVAHEGIVALDSETSAVLRLTVVSVGIPKGFLVLSSTMSVDYGFTDVAGREYLLPMRAESEMRRPPDTVMGRPYNVSAADAQRVSRNLVTFVNYRKFTADSNIVFDTDSKKK
jgi:hypothetical protein